MAASDRGLTPAALSELAELPMATSSFDDLMQSVADLAARAVPAATTCGITLPENGHVITVASADGLARLLDEQQYELDIGQCLETMSAGKVVRCDDHRPPSAGGPDTRARAVATASARCIQPHCSLPTGHPFDEPEQPGDRRVR